MGLSVKSKTQEQFYSAYTGITLLEIGLGIVIAAVIGVSVSSLVRAGIESQLSEQINQNVQLIGNNIVDDLRYDIRLASRVNTIADQQLTLTVNGQTITYSLAGTTFSRQVTNGTQKIYNDQGIEGNGVEITCNDPLNGSNACFTVPNDHNGAILLNSENQPKQIFMPYLAVRERPGRVPSILDLQFGTLNYTVRDFGFTVYSATEFQ
ncbi:MAG: hypothetical protein AAGI66_01120 [Cyanobacteria bacterium P01_H01_bin.74]